MKKRNFSPLILLLTALIWGFAFVAQRVGGDYVGTFTYNGVRFLLGAVSLLPVIFFFERKMPQGVTNRRLLTVGTVCGVILFSASTLQQYGVVIGQSAGKAGFLTGLYTVLVPVAAAIGGKKQRANTWIAAVAALGGLFLLSATDSLVPSLGDLLLILGALFWAAHILVIDRYAATLPALRFSMIQFAVCGVLSVIGALCFETISLPAIADAAVPILYGGLLSVGVAYTLQAIGQRGCNPAFSSVILSTEAIFSAVGGALILGERLTLRGYLGCALIFGGILIAKLPPRNKNNKG